MVESSRSDGETAGLSYKIELWGSEDGGAIRILARAANASLARAIFRTASAEYPGRRIVLRRGTHIIAESKRAEPQ